jgi:hypothetical protein
VSQKSAQAISVRSKWLQYSIVIQDTATDFIGLPSTILEAMMRLLHAEYDATYDLYTVDCDVMNSSPKMLFTIGGVELFVDNFEYILDVSFKKYTKFIIYFLVRTGRG